MGGLLQQQGAPPPRRDLIPPPLGPSPGHVETALSANKILRPGLLSPSTLLPATARWWILSARMQKVLNARAAFTRSTNRSICIVTLQNPHHVVSCSMCLLWSARLQRRCLGHVLSCEGTKGVTFAVAGQGPRSLHWPCRRQVHSVQPTFLSCPFRNTMPCFVSMLFRPPFKGCHRSPPRPQTRKVDRPLP